MQQNILSLPLRMKSGFNSAKTFFLFSLKLRGKHSSSYCEDLFLFLIITKPLPPQKIPFWLRTCAINIIIFLHCLFLCHAFIALIFYQNRPKIKLLKKNTQNPKCWGLCHIRLPPPPLQFSAYAPAHRDVKSSRIHVGYHLD